MEDFKAGDKVICLTHGKGVVTEVTEDETNNFNVICEFGNTRVCYSINGKSPLCKGRMLYHADEPLKAVTHDPIEIPHISNAMEAIDLLDKGKKIISDTFYDGKVYCLKDEFGKVFCHDIMTGVVIHLYTISIFNLFSHDWREHKHQYRFNFIQAIRLYNKGYKVKLNDCTLCLNCYGEFILVNNKGQETDLDNKHLTSEDWKSFIE